MINWTAVDAIAEVVATFVTVLSIIILVLQIIRQAKQHSESTIRSEWYILNTQRLQIESDLSKFHPAPQSVYPELMDKRSEIVEQMHKLRKQYPDLLPDWPLPQTFATVTTVAETESDSRR